MTPRTYSNTAVETTLSGGIDNVVGSLVVASAAGYPTAPFAIVVDSGAVAEEVMLVTNKAGTTFTVTRGYDGSSPSAHANGAAVIHAAIADDFRGMQLGTRDVATTLPTDTQALVWSDANSRWQPGAAAGSTKALPTLVVGSSTWTGYADYTCDGTDDQVQIQQAIDALPAAGGTVVLTDGLYTVAQAGTITGDSLSTPYCIAIRQTHGAVVLTGAGPGATKIKLANSQASNVIPLIMRGTSAAKRTAATIISGIEFDGNSSGGQGVWTDFGIVEAVYADYVTLERCYVHDAPFFLTQTFRNSNQAHWRGNRFVSSSTNHQVRFEAPGVTVFDNDFEGAAGATAGAMLSLATNSDINVTTTEARVIGNRFVGGFTAIDIGGGQRNIVAHNIIKDQTNSNSISIKVQHYAGAVFFDAVENQIHHNTLFNIRNGVQLGGTAGNGSLRNYVEQNLIIESSGVNLNKGLEESGAFSDYNVFRDNHITGATTPITTSGANTLSYENRIDGVMTNATLKSANNLSDVANTTTARTNIGAGTVTSVAMTVPADLSVAGSPVTTTGTLAVTRNTQSANQFLGGPTSGSAATPAYRALTATDLPDFHQYVYYHEEFLVNTPSGTSISGAAAAITLNSASVSDAGGNPGWGAFQTGSTSTGRALVCPPGTVAAILLGNGAWVFETLINLPILSDGTETYTIRAGFNDSTTAAGADAVMFSYTNGASSGNWECITRSNSNQTLTDSTINVGAATNYKLRIEINAAASTALFFINGVQRANHSANIPSGAGRQTMALIGIVKSLGGTSRELLVDYLHYECALTSAR